MRSSTHKWALVVFWHVGPAADPSGTGRLRGVCSLMLVTPQTCVCVSPPSPTLSAKSKKVTVAVNATFYTLRLLAFFLAGRELHRGEVNVYRHNTMTVYQR